MEKQVGDYTISTDKARLDLEVIHNFLFTCHWCRGIPKEVMEHSIQHSLCFGVYKAKAQVGFARVVTDYATFMYIGDAFILEAHCGHGSGVAMMEMVVNHPDLQGVRTWLLLTADAHGRYAKLDFEIFESERVLRRNVPYPYKE